MAIRRGGESVADEGRIDEICSARCLCSPNIHPVKRPCPSVTLRGSMRAYVRYPRPLLRICQGLGTYYQNKAWRSPRRRDRPSANVDKVQNVGPCGLRVLTSTSPYQTRRPCGMPRPVTFNAT